MRTDRLTSCPTPGGHRYNASGRCEWCDAERQDRPKAPPLGIPQDVDMPAGLSPGARTLFRALKALNRHGDPDRMMDDLNKGKMEDA